MNDYEIRQAAKKVYLEERAERLSKEAQRLNERASQMASVIPLGQPILVGHGSEKRDRRYRARINSTYEKATAAHEASEAALKRASSIGNSGISSDDPDAPIKLREKLANTQEHHEHMLAANRAIRKGKTNVERATLLMALGLTQRAAEVLLEPDFAGRIGYAPYALTNSNGRMKQITQRLAILEQKAAAVEVVEESSSYTYVEDPEENRIMFTFTGKPSEDIRKILKYQGFRWSPTRGTWVTNLSNAGRWKAGLVKDALKKLEASVEA